MTSSATKWLDAPEAKPAPAPLDRVQALVNSVDRESGADRLVDLAGATAWLGQQHIRTAPGLVTPKEVRRVIEVREALRTMLVHNAGGPQPGEAALRPLRQVADAATARVTVDLAGAVDVTVADESVQAGLLRLLLVVRDAQHDGTWAHLKACGNDACQWAFYDRSRNHGGMWCDMSLCGNKLKNRDFRARRRRSQSLSD